MDTWEDLMDERDARRRLVQKLEGSNGKHVYHEVVFGSQEDYDLPDEATPEMHASAAHGRKVIPDPLYATVISSALASEWKDPDITHDERRHTVMLDIDHPVQVRETSPGKAHLFIDKAMPWSDLVKLLDVMVEVGLVEEGYAGASKRRYACHLRMPWIKKPEVTD